MSSECSSTVDAISPQFSASIAKLVARSMMIAGLSDTFCNSTAPSGRRFGQVMIANTDSRPV